MIHLLSTVGGLAIEARASTVSGEEGSGQATLRVDLAGADTPLLTARNGELLHAIEHIAAKMLRLEPDQHDSLLFEADHFKQDREEALLRAAAAGVARVRATGRPYAFAPMNSRERRMLHLALAPSGLASASTSDGPRRFVVLYPAGTVPQLAETPACTQR